jgi:hypothetical protein
MQLPQDTAAYTKRVSFGRYVLTRLKRAKLTDQANTVEAKNNQVKVAGRAWEDTDESIQDALASRDADDDALDNTAKDFRFALASRSRQAAKESPYTNIFPKGIEYYTEAPLDEEVDRYQELITRTEAHLPKEDTLRQETVKALQTQLKSFSASHAAVAAARTQEGIARTRLLAAQDVWDDLLEKTYGSLVEQFKKAKAERFFPKQARARSDSAEPETSNTSK